MVLMDNKFEKLRNLVPILTINMTVAKEHVPEVERKIRLIKERERGILNTPSIQEDAQADADRAGLSRGALAECLPNKIRSV
jgi:hypothetical protein